MGWICGDCKAGRHKACKFMSFFCHCQCNNGGVADFTEKVISTVGGAGVAALGLGLTIASFGVAAPIGGAIMGAGISSAWHGTEKLIQGKRISKRSYCADVGFGVVSGLVTGGIGAVGETVAANAVKQGAKVGAKKLAVRAVTGAVAGLTSKAVDEVKQCSTTEKQWSDYGKTFDAKGNQSGTVTSWVASAAAGGLGGASNHVSSNLTKLVPSGVVKSVTRVAVSAGTAAASDATIQGINIVAGHQDTYDGRRTLISTATSAGMAAAQEGTKNAIYRAHGGKSVIAADRANRKAFKSEKDNESEDRMRRYNELKKIAQSKVKKNHERASTRTDAQTAHESLIENIDKIETSAKRLMDESRVIIRNGGTLSDETIGHIDSTAKSVHSATEKIKQANGSTNTSFGNMQERNPLSEEAFKNMQSRTVLINDASVDLQQANQSVSNVSNNSAQEMPGAQLNRPQHAVINKLQAERSDLLEQRQTCVTSHGMVTSAYKSDPTRMLDDHGTHCHSEGRLNQISVDHGPITMGPDGSRVRVAGRDIFDMVPDAQGNNVYLYAGSTDSHDYETLAAPGASESSGIYKNEMNHLESKKRLADFIVINETLKRQRGTGEE